MPAPGREGAPPFNAFPADLGRKHWAEAVPPETDGLVADVDPALVEEVLDVPQR
jgi:hypothetical protein